MADRSGLGPLLSGVCGLLLCIGARGAAEVTVKDAVGSNASLVPTYSGDPSDITWKLDGNKLVTMDLEVVGEELRVKGIKFYRLQERATIVPNGTLTIRGVTKEDSKTYRAEVVVGGSYQNTDVTLIVLDCPDEPTISTEEIILQIILHCESATPEVTYEWWNGTIILSQGPSYTAIRTNQAVTLTCVVYNDVCRNSTDITIPRIPESGRGLHGAAIAAVVVVLPLILIIIVVLLRQWNRVRRRMPCLTDSKL